MPICAGPEWRRIVASLSSSLNSNLKSSKPAGSPFSSKSRCWLLFSSLSSRIEQNESLEYELWSSSSSTLLSSPKISVGGRTSHFWRGPLQVVYESLQSLSLWSSPSSPNMYRSHDLACLSSADSVKDRPHDLHGRRLSLYACRALALNSSTLDFSSLPPLRARQYPGGASGRGRRWSGSFWSWRRMKTRWHCLTCERRLERL
mmetsp:Transcript_20280/g.40903  ORF Transcript_20280/g.40903 Transcript_20280/m.40903 type:complete len:203 (-) Transcript_20280:434-1042(-)